MIAVDYLAMLRAKNEKFLSLDVTGKTGESTLRGFPGSSLEGKNSNSRHVSSVGVSDWWRLRLADGGEMEVFVPSGETLAGILKTHPEAVSAEPFKLEHTKPDAAMTREDETAIRAWLAHIGEQSPEIINDVLAQCQRSIEARDYYTKRAKG
jgi:hypothetical protein